MCTDCDCYQNFKKPDMNQHKQRKVGENNQNIEFFL